MIGFKLTGRLPEGATPTDLTLTIVQMLRTSEGVVDKFVEFYGDGLDHLAVTDRVMIANMSPENGATVTYFPVDAQTLDYLRLTGRPAELVELVEAYYQAQGLFRAGRHARPRVYRRRSSWIWARSSPAWPAPSARRTAWPCAKMQPDLQPGAGRAARARAATPWRRKSWSAAPPCG